MIYLCYVLVAFLATAVTVTGAWTAFASTEKLNNRFNTIVAIKRPASHRRHRPQGIFLGPGGPTVRGSPDRRRLRSVRNS